MVQKEDSYKVRVYKRSAGGLEATYDGCHVFIPWKYTFVQQANSEEVKSAPFACSF